MCLNVLVVMRNPALYVVLKIIVDQTYTEKFCANRIAYILEKKLFLTRKYLKIKKEWKQNRLINKIDKMSLPCPGGDSNTLSNDFQSIPVPLRT